MNKLIKPLDLLLIVLLLLGGTGAWLYAKQSTSGATAVIYINGEVFQSIELEKVAEAYEIELPCTPKATLFVEKGEISFKKAECKDKVCVNTGKLNKRSDTAACLPAKVVVTIKNGEKQLDAMVY